MGYHLEWVLGEGIFLYLCTMVTIGYIIGLSQTIISIIACYYVIRVARVWLNKHEK